MKKSIIKKAGQIIKKDRIPNTDLFKQYQGEREIYPIFIPENSKLMIPDQCDLAFLQALSAGYRSVMVCGDLYAFLGEWCFLGTAIQSKGSDILQSKMDIP